MHHRVAARLLYSGTSAKNKAEPVVAKTTGSAISAKILRCSPLRFAVCDAEACVCTEGGGCDHVRHALGDGGTVYASAGGLFALFCERIDLVHLTEQRALSGVQAGDPEPCVCQCLLQLFVMTACKKAAGGNDQKPLAELGDLLHDGVYLLCTVENADAVIVNKILVNSLVGLSRAMGALARRGDQHLCAIHSYILPRQKSRESVKSEK